MNNLGYTQRTKEKYSLKLPDDMKARFLTFSYYRTVSPFSGGFTGTMHLKSEEGDFRRVFLKPGRAHEALRSAQKGEKGPVL